MTREEGTPQPADWEIDLTDTARGLQHGSVLVIAHHVDAMFGNARVLAVD